MWGVAVQKRKLHEATQGDGSGGKQTLLGMGGEVGTDRRHQLIGIPDYERDAGGIHSSAIIVQDAIQVPLSVFGDGASDLFAVVMLQVPHGDILLVEN
jgi:hypothetical protein